MVQFLATDRHSIVTKPRAVYAVTFLQTIANNGRYLIVPLHATALGATLSEVGLLFATQALVHASLSIPVGMISDRFGRRRTILVALVAGILAAILAAVGDFPLLYLSQCLAGFSQATVQTVSLSALAAAVPPGKLGRTIAAQVMASQTGLLLGPALAGAALSFFPARITMALCAIPVLASIPSTFWGIDPRSSTVPAVAPLRPALRDFARAESVYAAALLTTLMTVMWGVQIAFLPLFASQNLHLATSQIGLVLALQAFTNVGARVPAGWLLDRIPEERRIYFCGICVTLFAVGLAAVPQTTAFWQLALLVCVITPILGTASVALPALFIRLSPAGRPGIVMGLYSLLVALGSAIGPAAFGPVMTLGFAAGYTATAVTSTALAVGVIVAQAWSPRKSAPDQISGT
jgi:MFS family permease